ILTGTLFGPVLRDLVNKLNTRSGSKLYVHPIQNQYFGGDVSVAGLLTGSDLATAKGHLRGKFVIIPRQMLKSDEPVFLDGLTVEGIEHDLGQPVYPLDMNGFVQFINAQN